MKRRALGLLAGSSLLALKTQVAQAAVDPTLLTTTLTPFGAERAENADGSIPAWTGGLTTVPSGWEPGDYMPSPYENEQSTLEINAGNMAQHSSRLSVGVQAMMSKYGYSIKVYPTHRSHALPQTVYDNIAKNAVSAKADPAGIVWGFTNASGGAPFPIPDSDPAIAGAQIIWNHAVRWQGLGYSAIQYSYAVSNGTAAIASLANEKWDFPYYFPNANAPQYSGMEFREIGYQTAPANGIGSETLAHVYVDNKIHPNAAWQLLTGQGRVRRAPEIGYDTPSSTEDGICNYDEYNGMGTPLDRYTWKSLGKREMYIPYNNNPLIAQTPEAVHMAHFFNPDHVRWELHRVWVVECVLAPGEHNVMARRTLYVDEDTWTVANADTYDAAGNLFHVGITYPMVRPDLPGVILAATTTNNLQTGDYCSIDCFFKEKARPSIKFNTGFPDYVFDPGRLAASAAY